MIHLAKPCLGERRAGVCSAGASNWAHRPLSQNKNHLPWKHSSDGVPIVGKQLLLPSRTPHPGSAGPCSSPSPTFTCQFRPWGCCSQQSSIFTPADIATLGYEKSLGLR